MFVSYSTPLSGCYAGSTFNAYETNPEDRLFDVNVNRDKEKAEDERERDHLAMIVNGMPAVRKHLAVLNGLLLDEIHEIYTTLALSGVRANNRSRCQETMRKNGLLAILNKTPGLADRYVQLSAECAITSNKERIAAALAQSNIDLKTLLQDLDQLWESDGFLLYVEFSNGLIFTLA